MERLEELELKHGVGELAHFVRGVRVEYEVKESYFWIYVGDVSWDRAVSGMNFKGSNIDSGKMNRLWNKEHCRFNTPEAFAQALKYAIVEGAKICVGTHYGYEKVYWDFSQRD